MIVDVHYHLVVEDWLPDIWWNEISKVYARVLKAMGMEMTVSDIKKNILGTFWDPDGEKLIAEMDEAGIDKTVILPLDYGFAMGEPKTSISEQNRAYAELQNKHPDRIIAFAGVDPRRPGATDLLEAAIKVWGLRGVKLHPGTGFYPDQRESYKFLAKVSEFGIPVLIHSGVWIGKSKYCDPIYCDNILIDFPNLTIIAAHLGRGWQNVLFEMGAHKPNLATDFSGWQISAQRSYRAFCENLRNALDSFGRNRVFFGTDGPFYRPAMSNKDFVQLIKELPEKAPEGLHFTEEEIEAVLGGSAARILGV